MISSLSQDRVITSRDGELSDMVMEAIGDNMEQYGIELIKFETKQLDLPDDNKAAVYERMISERDNIAATYKAEGDSEAKVIQNKTDKEVTIQISDAKKQAEILKAEGEQEYMKILSQAYGEDERSEFYSFVRSLEALKASMQGETRPLFCHRIPRLLRFLRENNEKFLHLPVLTYIIRYIRSDKRWR